MAKEENIFLASIKDRYCLNPGSEKETYHLVLDLKGSGIEYQVGDCLGIYPQNDPSFVENLLLQLQASGDEIVQDRAGASFPLKELLLNRANLLRLPQDANLSISAFSQKLSPLLPRYYSIASSMRIVGTEAHLTVALIDGTCSQYLCKRAPLNTPVLSVFHHPARQFSLPTESFSKPIIMIGPGTGIAPFRGFMQERVALKSQAKSWLFFGERHRQTDFYYKNYWEGLVAEGHLEVDLAFSRDQDTKVYVQHKMREKKQQLWQWLQEDAYLFVCGDASHMAKDVDKTLHTIIEEEGGLSPIDAKNFIKNLRKQGRYQRDVY